MNIKKQLLILSVLATFLILIGYQNCFAECKECTEVAKGKIPAEFLDPSLKKLPSGIAIWDVEEAMSALKKKNSPYLWVDTRPKSFYEMGTIKNAAHLVYDQSGKTVPEDKHGPALTKERLMAAMSQGASLSKVVFYCQGPKCHRSYNAALKTVKEFGFQVDQVIWFRGGYPNLETHIMDNPKLNKRISRYLQGENI
jgi:hypothetical protein